MKQKGILMPIASLYSGFGIGDLGPEAYNFADYLARGAYRYWQILPLNYCGYGNSPYNPISSWAGYEYLISPQLLFQDGLITRDMLQEAMVDSEKPVIDYQTVFTKKNKLHSYAASRFLNGFDIDAYISENEIWIKPFLAFRLLTESYGHSKWYEWNDIHKRYSDKLFDHLTQDYEEQLKQYAAIQYLFFSQFRRLKQFLKSRSIELIGDIPLYVSYESADVWACPQNFRLDVDGSRLYVAGVPPDAFSETGQLWGNPIYNWDYLKLSNYQWFRNRISHALGLYDHLRLDHFIGIVNYWQIDGKSETAMGGTWIDAPGDELLEFLVQDNGQGKLIAEDLGILTDKVCHIRDKYGLPGMIILQFCFDNQIPQTDSFPKNKIIYTGTHDNNTTLGWYLDAMENNPDRISNLARYFVQQGQISKETDLNQNNICKLLIASALSSPCETAIIPMQDILALDASSRTNIPGTALGNWQWRMHQSITTILK